jgi:hypothetical protein
MYNHIAAQVRDFPGMHRFRIEGIGDKKQSQIFFGIHAQFGCDPHRAAGVVKVTIRAGTADLPAQMIAPQVVFFQPELPGRCFEQSIILSQHGLHYNPHPFGGDDHTPMRREIEKQVISAAPPGPFAGELVSAHHYAYEHPGQHIPMEIGRSQFPGLVWIESRLVSR